MKYVINSPLSVAISKKKKFILNLNNYRNASYFILNTAKQKYKKLIIPQLRDLPTFNKVRLTYCFFPATKRRYDVSNVCSVVDKFFSDALVETGHLSDDNYHYIPDVLYCIGSLDKNNPRVQILIEEIK